MSGSRGRVEPFAALSQVGVRGGVVEQREDDDDNNGGDDDSRHR